MRDYIALNADDQILWQCAKEGDNLAFKALYDKYWLVLNKLVSRYITEKASCEDIVHDVFLAIYTKRDRLRIENFSNYLLSSTRYEVFRYQKKAVKRQSSFSLDQNDGLHLSTCNDGIQQLNRKEIKRMVSIGLQPLPKRCREIFIMSRHNELSNDDIARTLNISKHTVENQLSYAIRQLKFHLKDYLIS